MLKLTIVIEIQINYTVTPFFKKSVRLGVGEVLRKYLTHGPGKCLLVQLLWRIIWSCSKKHELVKTRFIYVPSCMCLVVTQFRKYLIGSLYMKLVTV